MSTYPRFSKYPFLIFFFLSVRKAFTERKLFPWGKWDKKHTVWVFFRSILLHVKGYHLSPSQSVSSCFNATRCYIRLKSLHQPQRGKSDGVYLICPSYLTFITYGQHLTPSPSHRPAKERVVFLHYTTTRYSRRVFFFCHTQEYLLGDGNRRQEHN